MSEVELKELIPPSPEQIRVALDQHFQNHPVQLAEALRKGTVQIRVKNGQIIVLS